MKRIILHIGTHKTATTSFQVTLAKNLEKLIKNGVYFPPPGNQNDGQIGHINFARALADKDTGKKMLDYYLKEFELSGCHTMLLSAETFSRPKVAKQAVHLLNTFSNNYSFSILCVLRRQDYFIESLYTTRILERKRAGMTFNEFFNQIEPRRYDYAYILSIWEELTSSFTIHNFNDVTKSNNLTDFLLTSVGLQPIKVVTERKNISPDRRLVQVFSAMNRSNLSYDDELLVILHNSICSYHHKLRHFMSVTARQKLLIECSTINQSLTDKYGLEFDTSTPRPPEPDLEKTNGIDYLISLITTLSHWQDYKTLSQSKINNDYIKLDEISLLKELAIMSKNKLIPDFPASNKLKQHIKDKFATSMGSNDIYLSNIHVNKLEKYFPDCIETDIALAEYFHVIEEWNHEYKQWQKCINNYDNNQVNNWELRAIECQIKLEDYSSAMSQVEELIENYAKDYAYKITKAKIYINTGEHRKAAELLEKLITKHPKRQRAYLCNLRLHSQSERPSELVKLTRKYKKYFPTNVTISMHQARAYMRLSKPSLAEKILKEVLDKDPSNLQAYIGYTNLAVLYFSGDRQLEILNTLQNKLTELSTQNIDNVDTLALFRLRARISYACRDWKQVRFTVDKIKYLYPQDKFANGLTIILDNHALDRNESKLHKKVFVIGLSKTGTTSISQALELLGYHSTHYTNKYTGSYISLNDAYLFDALSDTPVCNMFEELYSTFPNAKFIYTTRDEKSWGKSIKNHFYKDYLVSDTQSLKKINRSFYWKKIHTSIYARFNSWTEAYHAYDKRVLDFFSDKPNDKMLILDVSEINSWDILCEFLGKDIPDFDFPWLNKTAQSQILSN